ncbi:hypothetical protein T8K17_22340 [Thalassobaculum sp. OXR-137]|uniref:hypothetical protein n=1 Tax=Thalassobaculum sp. OXR-137 TaxID=3100173 RepID=UPI002AC9E3A4|nr:hypothetical protein [Thalassobaculum sp. OXR-137]WPZ33966.1 hypothetical protein T8K17_22340 [Thalassobaculum sp. OXR-137]
MGEEQKSGRRTERLQLMLDDEELTRIDDWRFDNRIPTRAAAIRELIRRGMLYEDAIDEAVDMPDPRDMKSTEYRAIPIEE